MRKMLVSALALAGLVGGAIQVQAQDHSTELNQFYQTFADLLNADDAAGIAELFGDNAIFVPAPGQPVEGKEAITGAFGQFAAISDNFEVEVRHTLLAGDIALVIADWTLSGKDANGQPLELAGSTSDVLVRDADGQWTYVIDNPFGTATGE